MEATPFPEMDTWIAEGHSEESFPAEIVGYASSLVPDLVASIKATMADKSGFDDYTFNIS